MSFLAACPVGLTLLGGWQEGHAAYKEWNLAPAIPEGSFLEDLRGTWSDLRKNKPIKQKPKVAVAVVGIQYFPVMHCISHSVVYWFHVTLRNRFVE